MLHKLVGIASAEVGVKEEGGNNRGIRVREYQQTTNLSVGAWPWCAAFVDWCVCEWLKDESVVNWLSLKNRTPDEWRPKTALAYGLVAWAKSRPNTTDIYNENNVAKLGDIVTFDFSHVGIVVEDIGTELITIEGNTNGKGLRDSTAGDGVWKKVRQKSLAKNFIRIHTSVAK